MTAKKKSIAMDNFWLEPLTIIPLVITFSVLAYFCGRADGRLAERKDKAEMVAKGSHDSHGTPFGWAGSLGWKSDGSSALLNVVDGSGNFWKEFRCYPLNEL